MVNNNAFTDPVVDDAGEFSDPVVEDNVPSFTDPVVDDAKENRNNSLRQRLKQKDSLLNKIGYVKNRTKDDKPDAEGLTLDDYRNFVTSSDFNTLDEERLNLVAQAIDTKHADVSKKRGIFKIAADSVARGIPKSIYRTAEGRMAAQADSQENRDTIQSHIDAEEETDVNHPRAVAGVKDIRGVGDALKLAVEVTGENVGNAVAPLAAGYAGAKAGLVAGGPVGAVIGAKVGSGIGSLYGNLGEAVRDHYKDTGEAGTSVGVVAQGIGYSVIDAILGGEATAIKHMFKGVSREALKAAKKNFVGSIGKAVLEVAWGGAKGGLGEALQSQGVGRTRRYFETGSAFEKDESGTDALWASADEFYGGFFGDAASSAIGVTAEYARNKSMLKRADVVISKLSADKDVDSIKGFDKKLVSDYMLGMAAMPEVDPDKQEVIRSKQAEIMDAADGQTKAVLNAYQSIFTDASFDNIPDTVKPTFNAQKAYESKIEEQDGSETYFDSDSGIMIQGRKGSWSVFNNNGLKMPLTEENNVKTIKDAIVFAQNLTRLNQWRIENNQAKSEFIQKLAEKNHPGANVVMVDSPLQIKDEGIRSRFIGNEQGFYNPGDNTVYMMLDAVQNPAQAAIILNHEDFHSGFDAVLKATGKTRDELLGNAGLGDNVTAEEYLAEAYAQREKDPATYSKAKLAVQKWIGEKTGIKSLVGDAEMKILIQKVSSKNKQATGGVVDYQAEGQPDANKLRYEDSFYGQGTLEEQAQRQNDNAPDVPVSQKRVINRDTRRASLIDGMNQPSQPDVVVSETPVGETQTPLLSTSETQQGQVTDKPSPVKDFVKTELRIDRIKEKHADLFQQAMDVTDGDEESATGLVSEWLAGQNIADKSIPDSVRVASKLEQKSDLTAKDVDTLEQNAIFGKDLFLFGYRKDKQTGSWKFREPQNESIQQPAQEAPQSTPVEPVTSEPVVEQKPVEAQSLPVSSDSTIAVPDAKRKKNLNEYGGGKFEDLDSDELKFLGDTSSVDTDGLTFKWAQLGDQRAVLEVSKDGKYIGRAVERPWAELLKGARFQDASGKDVGSFSDIVKPKDEVSVEDKHEETSPESNESVKDLQRRFLAIGNNLERARSAVTPRQRKSFDKEWKAFYVSEMKKAEEDRQAESKRKLDAAPVLPGIDKTVVKASQQDMLKEALRWQGAHVNAELELRKRGDKRGLYLVASTSGKTYLDDYLMNKFGVDRSDAHEVSNQITRMNLPPDKSAKIEDFAGEEWADSVLSKPVVATEKPVDSQQKPLSSTGKQQAFKRGTKVATTRNADGISYFGEVLQSNTDGTVKIRAFKEKSKGTIAAKTYGIDKDGNRIKKDVDVPADLVKSIDATADTSKMSESERRKFKMAAAVDAANADNELRKGNVEAPKDIVDSFNSAKERKEQRKTDNGEVRFRRAVTPEQDAEYLEAVKEGNNDVAQRLLDTALDQYAEHPLGRDADGWYRHRPSVQAVGYRIGNPPDSGRSFNSRDQQQEDGVSLIGVGKLPGIRSFAISSIKDNDGRIVYLKGDVLTKTGGDDEFLMTSPKVISRQEFERDLESDAQRISDYTLALFQNSRRGVSPSKKWIEALKQAHARVQLIVKDKTGRIIPLSERFNEESNNTRFRRAMNGTPSGADILDTETGLQAARRIVQDYMHLWARKQSDIEKANGHKLADDVDVYRAEDNSYGLVWNDTQQFEKGFIDKAKKSLKENGLSVEEFDQFLKAKAGPDRNRMISERTDGKNLTGSGQSDTYWHNILAAYRKQGKYDKLNEAAEHVWALNRAVLDMKVEAGLMSKAQADVWKTKSPFYVPLRNDDAEADYNGLEKRASFSLKRKESKSATGRAEGHEADTPFAFSVLQALEAVGRANKNKVYETAAKLIEQNPSDLWRIETRIPTKQAYDADTGKVISVPDTQFEDAPNVVIVKRDGKKQYLVFEGADGLKLARSLKKDSLQKAPALVSALTRTYAMLRTAMVPTFIERNLRADILTLAINMTAEQKIKMIPEVFKNMNDSWQAVWSYERDGKASGKLAAYADEFFANGGRIAGVGVQTVDKINQTLNRHVKKHGKFMTNIGMPALNFYEYIERGNASIETGTRISLYAAMRKRGFSISDSIEAAKNITVNFNRKGELGPLVNSLYMFANVAVQDVQRSIRALSGKNGKAVVIGLLGAGFLASLLNNGDDDEEDKTGAGSYKNIPESDKQRNIIIKVGGKYIKQPIRGLWAWIYYVGTKAGDVAFGKYDPVKAAKDVAGAAFDTINFLGTSGSVTQFIMPTIVDPVIQHDENRDWKGSPIYQRKFTEAQPDSATGMKRTPNWIKSAAKGLNRLTGGDDATKGWIDVAPETIKFVIDTMAGGLGTDTSFAIGAVSDAVKGEFDVDKTPFVRDVVRDLPDNTRRYYEAKDKFDEGVYKMNHYKTSKEKRRLMAKSPFMKPTTANRIKNLNKTINEIRELESKTKSDDRKRLHEARRLRLQSTVLSLMNNSATK